MQQQSAIPFSFAIIVLYQNLDLSIINRVWRGRKQHPLHVVSRVRLYGRCLDVFLWLECFGRSEDLVPRHLVRYYYLFLFCLGGPTHTNHTLPPPPTVIQHPRKPYGHQGRYLCDWSSGGFIVIQVGITDRSIQLHVM